MSRSRIPGLLLILALAGCEPFEPWFDYAADDPNLQFIGRLDHTTDEGPTYPHPGTTVRFRCNCTGVDVAFEDKGEGGNEHTNFVSIVVDGVEEAKVELKPKGGALMYKGARNLARGEHIVEVVKATESYAGNIRFVGLSLQGIILDPPPRQEKRIEFIGDSITCGYGNEVRIFAPNNTEPNTGYHTKNENITKAYGAIIGRRFNAETVQTCISGTGVYRNLNGKTVAENEDTFPVLYDRLYPNDPKSKWDPQDFVPHLVVINLGNNDFNVLDEARMPTPPDPEGFKQAYKDFVLKLRRYYPEATIVCSIGPLMNDNFPKGGKHWTRIQDYVSTVVKAINDGGDSNVYYFAYKPITGDPYGEDWHPTAEGHQVMADAMSAFLQKIGAL
ncbi:SGNH/GDSL hydrolase family protein [Archangium sp.]|jgi:lysophospholipase L1-like esterase|uniref:SGNH/GDSL hydrolase family protein n=1 Tax=Archangium sp. TaxID=1872627 RepID=UPI002ED9D446